MAQPNAVAPSNVPAQPAPVPARYKILAQDLEGKMWVFPFRASVADFSKARDEAARRCNDFFITGNLRFRSMTTQIDLDPPEQENAPVVPNLQL
jgi:hypothetical protein